MFAAAAVAAPASARRCSGRSALLRDAVAPTAGCTRSFGGGARRSSWRPGRAGPVARRPPRRVSVVGEAHYDVRADRRLHVWHLADLALYVGVIPSPPRSCSLPGPVARPRRPGVPRRYRLARSRSRPRRRRVRNALRAIGSTSGTCSSSRPLFLILAARLGRARSAARRGVIAPLAAAASRSAAPLAIPFDRFVGDARGADTLTLLPVWAIQLHSLTWLEWLAFLGASVVRALAFVARAAARGARAAADRPRLVRAVLQAGLSPARTASGRRRRGRRLPGDSRRRPRTGSTMPCRRGRCRGALERRAADRFVVNQNEFFNRAVGQVYYTERSDPGGAHETAVHFERSGSARTADGRLVRSRYLLTDGASSPTALPSRATRPRHDGLAPPRAARSDDHDRGPLPGHLVGHAASSGRASLPRRHCSTSRLQRPELSTAATVSRPRRADASRRRARLGLTKLRVPCPPTPARASSASRSRRRRAQRRHPGQHGHRVARRPFPPSSHRHDEDRLRRPPLSHPRPGSATTSSARSRGLVEAAGESTRSSRSRRRACAAAACIPEALAGIPVEVRLRVASVLAPFRMAWSRRGRPPVERFLGAGRRPPLLGLDVSAAAGGVRATTIHDLVPLRYPEWVTARTREMHGEKYADTARTCDVIFANSAFTGGRCRRAPRCAARARPRRPAGRRGGVLAPRGAAPTSGGRTSSASATLEPRKNLGRSSRRWRLLGGELVLVLAGGEGWGEQPLLDDRGMRALGFVSDERAAARSTAAPRSSSIPRGSRGSGCRSSRRWRAGRRSSRPRTVDGRGLRATPPCVPTRTIPEAIAAAIEEAIERPRRARGRGIEHAARFTWRAAGEIVPARLRGGPYASGSTLAPLVQTQARDGAPVRGLLRALGTVAGLELVPLTFGGPGGPSTVAPRRAWYPVGIAARRARLDVLHCTTMRGPSRSRAPWSSPSTISPCSRHPEAFPAVAPAYTARSLLRHGVRRADAVVAVSAFTKTSSSSCSGSPGNGSVSSRTASSRSSPLPVGRPSGDYVLAVGTLEPRKNLGRGRGGGPARRRRAAGRRRARLGSGHGSRLGWPCRRRRAGGALPGRSVRRLPVALRGLRASGAGGDGVRHAGRDEPRRRDRGSGRGRRGTGRPGRRPVDRGRDRRGLAPA